MVVVGPALIGRLGHIAHWLLVRLRRRNLHDRAIPALVLLGPRLISSRRKVAHWLLVRLRRRDLHWLSLPALVMVGPGLIGCLGHVAHRVFRRRCLALPNKSYARRGGDRRSKQHLLHR